jgi:hypothetical protein
MAKWNVDCDALTKEPRSEGQDIVVQLERLAFYAERVIEDDHGKRLILADGVENVARAALNEIVNLRIKLFVAQAPKMPDEEAKK